MSYLSPPIPKNTNIPFTWWTGAHPSAWNQYPLHQRFYVHGIMFYSQIKQPFTYEINEETMLKLKNKINYVIEMEEKVKVKQRSCSHVSHVYHSLTLLNQFSKRIFVYLELDHILFSHIKRNIKKNEKCKLYDRQCDITYRYMRRK